MPAVFDYLQSYGHKTFTRSAPYNEADAIVFSRFIYLPFKAISLSDSEIISSLGQKFSKVGHSTHFFWDDEKLIHSISKLPRYKDLLVTDFVFRANNKTSEQFAAATVHLPTNEKLVIYIGTDDTINGWREDCYMSFMDEVPAQKSAKKYLKAIAKKYPESHLRICGHSKGGNLSLFAAVTATDKIVKRIVSVDCLDGPGLSQKLAEKSRSNPIIKRIKNFIPPNSIAGRLFFHPEKYIVIKSNQEKVQLQHNLYSWQINLKTNAFIRSNISQKSDISDRTISGWISNATKKQRQAFIDAAFRGIELSNFDNPADIAAAGTSAFPQLLKSYLSLDKKERKILLRGFKKLARLAISEKRHQKKQIKHQKKAQTKRSKKGK